MSYDLVGVRVQDGESVEDAVERLEELADDDTPPTDAEWDGMRSLGDRLTAADLFLVPQLATSRSFGVDLTGFPRILAAEAAALATEHARAARPA